MNQLKQLFDELPSSINNPFNKQSIDSIFISGYPDPWKSDGSWKIEGSVQFKNGNTRGEQRFESNNFGELLNKIANFCLNEL